MADPAVPRKPLLPPQAVKILAIAFGAVKAWIAFMIATNEIASRHRVDLDTTIATMAQTGRAMSNKYKETSTGGLALNLTLC